MTVSDGQTSKSAVMVDDYREDQDGDAVMTTQEAQLLGQTLSRKMSRSQTMSDSKCREVSLRKLLRWKLDIQPKKSRFADYQLRAETHMEAQQRQHLDEMAAFEREFQTLRLERDQERETNKNLQSFPLGRLKKQAERQGVNDNGLKRVLTTQVYVNPDSTTGKPVSSGVNTGVPPVLRKQMVPPEVKTLYATQTQLALRDLDETKANVARAGTAKAATTTAVKTEATADVRRAPAEGKPRKRSARKPDQGKKEPPKDDLKKKTPPSRPTMKHGPPDDEPSDNDNDSDKESGDSDSDTSSFEDLASGTQARATNQGMIMFNLMVNITALEDFDEKQPLAVRTRWLEKFQSLAIAGKADIDIKSTDIARDRHLKGFIKKLKDTQLRSTWQGQRVRSLKDLEHILKQHEEIWWSDDGEARPLKGSD
ncbi:hypothetical protein PHMEG_00028979, partial [Phytophthora megakarya]